MILILHKHYIIIGQANCNIGVNPIMSIINLFITELGVMPNPANRVSVVINLAVSVDMVITHIVSFYNCCIKHLVM